MVCGTCGLLWVWVYELLGVLVFGDWWVLGYCGYLSTVYCWFVVIGSVSLVAICVVWFCLLV